MGSGRQETFKPQELDQIFATIALYPYSLPFVAGVDGGELSAEDVEAARWSKANPTLRGTRPTRR